ncbi:glycosyltransferase [Lacticaseibacillus casei]|jgi:glycosyltransferase involved in cell wall biosynthesis|uniref:Glycosyltransferase n=1 Tax=Lacticaseibacillus huelsenbergensis TaxID=3035291 RepID=A0ABY8DQY2_9LACO|nr:MULTISPECIES: glycosyltransferase [Lacticaseibacillus]MDG3060846.1 glycosyltransferase [Lacticaseibacillus sp. BCRC 81376]QVI37366.1 glycosyltransferase [Lacticaseibacillus casei]QXG59156.1 glycosyltransferase [Lacticaseibacillus casei]WFB39391.1 glycosyltransferase [Lacticaseibacillus huelsenbergensis]WFB41094.1 glycosyltransferase [Lacticaseibacillus huelsenbergensis]
MNDQLSIIIPVFNSQNYLPRLFKSLGAIPPTVEVVLVDNGSTDNSAQLLQHFHEVHTNSLLIDEAHAGVAFARNAGLERAHGKYIWFVDADDTLQPNAINRILKVINDIDFDLLIFDYRSLTEQDTASSDDQTPKTAQKTDLAAVLHEMLTGAHDPIGGFPHNKIFARSLIGADRFPDFKSAEDMAFFVPILFRAKHIYRLRETLYDYYQHANSIVHKIRADKLIDYAKVMDLVEQRLRSNGTAPKNDVDEYILRRRLSIYFQNLAEAKDPWVKKHIRKKMKQYSWKQLLSFSHDKKLMVKILLYKFRILDVFPFLLKYFY